MVTAVHDPAAPHRRHRAKDIYDFGCPACLGEWHVARAAGLAEPVPMREARILDAWPLLIPAGLAVLAALGLVLGAMGLRRVGR